MKKLIIALLLLCLPLICYAETIKINPEFEKTLKNNCVRELSAIRAEEAYIKYCNQSNKMVIAADALTPDEYNSILQGDKNLHELRLEQDKAEMRKRELTLVGFVALAAVGIWGYQQRSSYGVVTGTLFMAGAGVTFYQLQF